MTDAKTIADQHISRGGRTAAYDKEAATDDLLDLANFLVWAESDGAYFGGVDAGQAYRAACRLLDVDVIALRKVALGIGL